MMPYLRASSSVRRIELVCASLRITVTQSIFVFLIFFRLQPAPVQIAKCVTERAELFFRQRLEYFRRQQRTQLTATLLINLRNSRSDVRRFNFVAHERVLQMILQLLIKDDTRLSQAKNIEWITCFHDLSQ